MTAALTCSYEKTVQFRVGHRTAAVSVKQTQLRRQIIPARQAGRGAATWTLCQYYRIKSRIQYAQF